VTVGEGVLVFVGVGLAVDVFVGVGVAVPVKVTVVVAAGVEHGPGTGLAGVTTGVPVADPF
jgi:hypothetical protein